MRSPSELIDKLGATATDAAMAAVVASAIDNEWASEDIMHLAETLAQSGARLTLHENKVTADVASTGGPSSLTTLLCPLYLRSYDFLVPKLGVPGRPAGGIDVLAQIDGYRAALTIEEVRSVLDTCGYAHFLAGPEFAPLDEKLFRLRQRIGAQDVPALAAASILAKKLACGIKLAGLDVRVAPHGNFGSNFSAARKAAALFCSAAAAAGHSAVAALTDARIPYQPFIGRGEAILALRLLFDGRADDWLVEHDHLCRLLAAHTAALQACSIASATHIRAFFIDNLAAQGSSNDAFYEKAKSIEESPRRALRAHRDGFLYIELGLLRAVFNDFNSIEAENIPFPDRLGLILKVRSGAYVKRGDLLALVRAENMNWKALSERLSKSFMILDVLDYAPGLEDIVRA